MAVVSEGSLVWFRFTTGHPPPRVAFVSLIAVGNHLNYCVCFDDTAIQQQQRGRRRDNQPTNHPPHTDYDIPEFALFSLNPRPWIIPRMKLISELRSVAEYRVNF